MSRNRGITKRRVVMFRMMFLQILFLTCFSSSFGQHYDWPMWRHDYNRSSSTPEQLADRLYLQWQIRYPAREPVWDDPLNQNLMQFDRIFEPVVAGDKLFIGFNDQDKVVALDLSSGKEMWHFFADGPVRLPLAINKDRIYFTGDDGYCYCLNAENGILVWKRLLAPAGNKLLGNKRLISMWPARGGIVIKDDIIYTAASVFPMMGTYIYALDARTGDIVWKNESTGSNYILQPHRSPAFADVAPQGPFTISGDKLLVAGGRTVPALFDLRTGEELAYQLAASGKTGGAFSCANNRVYFNHHRGRMTYMYDSRNGNKLVSDAGEYPVVEGNIIYFSGKKIRISRLTPENTLEPLMNINVSATNDLIKAGNCLYAADSSGIKAIKLQEGNKHEVIWGFGSEKIIERLLASNGKLIAVTNDGTIMVFGDSPVAKITNLYRPQITVDIKKGAQDKLLQVTGVRDGYGLVLGTEDINLLKSLLVSTSLDIVAYEKNAARVSYLRDYFDKAGINAKRISIQHFDRQLPELPKYFSSLIVINDLDYVNGGDPDAIKKIYESLRPYGGRMLVSINGKANDLIIKTINEARFSGAEISEGKGYALISRPGPLEGSSSWTHNYGNIANTVKSDDKLVKAPLGILWFGGNSNLDVLPRHGHGPGEQVIDGKLIIQGVGTISARDVYTGRVLWRRNSEKLLDDSWMVYWDESYDGDSPLDTKYNQEHLTGSNSRGTNFIATKEYVYLIEGNKCNLIDINTGNVDKVFTTGTDNTRRLGYIGVYEDLLILGSNFAEFSGLENDSLRINDRRSSEYNYSASMELFILNRFTGEKMWSISANHGFIHNSVIAGDGIIFCLDKLPQYLETKLRRRGETPPAGSRLLYLDAKTGKILHEETKDVFGTWLGYSSEYKLLLQATRPSRDMLNGEEGNRMITYNVQTRNKIWDKAIKYNNPPIIHNDKIYFEGEGYHLLSGDLLMETDPITGEELKWNFTRGYGCGIVAASEYLLTFRSASAGFINLEAFEGTGSLGGWKASCSTNLIVADGVLNSPDYTRTCQCPYQNQTSLALINMPWMSYWTFSNYKWTGKQIRHLALNFNAPGDRSSENDVLWLAYPFVAGSAPGIPVKLDTAGFRKIRKEPIHIISRNNTPWASSSALGGIRSLEIGLSKDKEPAETSYTVKLYFSELEEKKPGERIFDVSIQGVKVADNLDIAQEAGKPDKEVIKTFNGIRAGKTLKIDLTPETGNTLISGIEIIQEVLSDK